MAIFGRKIQVEQQPELPKEVEVEPGGIYPVEMDERGNPPPLKFIPVKHRPEEPVDALSESIATLTNINASKKSVRP